MSPNRKKFLAPEILQEAAEQVVAIARAEDTAIILIGGYAMQIYGSDRLTGDIDFAAEAMLEHLPNGKPLSFGGEQTTAPNGTPVDLVIRQDEYQQLYEAAIEDPILHLETGLPLVKPEYLAGMKMAAGRDRDLHDLKVLILSGVLDFPRTEHVIKVFMGAYAVREFRRIVEVTRWEASREEK